VVDSHGACGPRHGLSGYYYRETRFLRTLRLQVNGEAPWLCESATPSAAVATFVMVHPELESHGGGGSSQSGDETPADGHGIPQRALDVRLRYAVRLAGLHAGVTVTNRSRRRVDFELAWVLDADFADIQEAQSGKREQEAAVSASVSSGELRFDYVHPKLPYATRVTASGANWRGDGHTLTARLTLEPQRGVQVALDVQPIDFERVLTEADVAQRQARYHEWRDAVARVRMPANLIAEAIIASNVEDLLSFPLLEGAGDEWLALQAGMPLYPALFGRDTLTVGWQAAFIDRGASLDASLTRLGRLQSARVDDWRDEEPGRIPYQVRQGPLARLDVNPYAAYYADFASPLMYVISLAHLHAWVGDTRALGRHWDTARRVMDWARDYGDRDGDGYLEYLTRSSKGTKNQGWKDSGDAIVYDDGRPVAAPIATCELQG
jgi:glycogen debranching enzyme